MGNILDCIKRPIETVPHTDLHEMDLCSIKSTSVSSAKVPSSLLEPSIETTLSVRFSWSRLKSMYYNESKTISINKLRKMPGILKTMESIFYSIECNINPMCQIFCDSANEIDELFLTQFTDCAGRNRMSFTSDRTMVEKINQHTKYMVLVHRYILHYLQSSQELGLLINYLKLLALSHHFMRVSPYQFELMDIIMGRFLLRSNYMCEQNAKAIVIYFNCVTRSIVQLLIHLQEEDASNINQSTRARENYRYFKTWYKYVEKLQGKCE